jgi:hypothetical protein
MQRRVTRAVASTKMAPVGCLPTKNASFGKRAIDNPQPRGSIANDRLGPHKYVMSQPDITL